MRSVNSKYIYGRVVSCFPQGSEFESSLLWLHLQSWLFTQDRFTDYIPRDSHSYIPSSS